MTFLGFLSVNGDTKVCMLVLFGRDCLQILVFKDSPLLSSNVVPFSIVRKYFKACAFLDEDSAGIVYVGFVLFKFISF